MNPPYPEFHHEIPYTISETDLDGSGSFDPLRWFVLFQGVAIQHARNLGVSLEEFRHAQHTWVLSGMKLSVKKHPAINTGVRVMTWPSGFNRLVACRSFLVVDDNDHVLASGESNWLIIDVQSRRPLRIEPFVSHIQIPEGASAYRMARISTPDSPVFGYETVVQETDIDINNHTNNISYIAWLLESLPAEYRETVSLAELEINYLAETMLGDRIEAGWVGDSGDKVLHVIRRADDNREIVRARSHWVKRA